MADWTFPGFLQSSLSSWRLWLTKPKRRTKDNHQYDDPSYQASVAARLAKE